MTKQDFLEKINEKTMEEKIEELIKNLEFLTKEINEFEKKEIIYAICKDSTTQEINKILNNSNLQLTLRDKIALTLRVNSKACIKQLLQSNKNALESNEENILKFATNSNKYFSTKKQEKKKVLIPDSLRYGIEIESRRN